MRDALQTGSSDGNVQRQLPMKMDAIDAMAKPNSNPLLREGPVFASVVIGLHGELEWQLSIARLAPKVSFIDSNYTFTSPTTKVEEEETH